MLNFCIVIKNFCVQMHKSCKKWHHLNQIKTNSQSFLVEESFWKTCHLINFNLGKRSRESSADKFRFSEEPQSKLFVCESFHAFISVGFEIFSLTHYSWFPVIFARFWLRTLSVSSVPVMCLWKYIRIQQKWKQMIWKSIKDKIFGNLKKFQQKFMKSFVRTCDVNFEDQFCQQLNNVS